MSTTCSTVPAARPKPDQDAQEPACLRPHQLPLTDCQPGAPRPAHRRIMADAHPARRCPQPIISATPSSPRCGSGSSSSAPASSKPSRESAWPSPQPVPRAACSDKSLSRCSPQDHERRGIKAPPKPNLALRFQSPVSAAVKKTPHTCMIERSAALELQGS